MTDFRPMRFQILPPVIKNLLIINVLVFLAQMAFAHSFDIDGFFALHDIHSSYFRPHQLVTHLFMHGGFDHLFVNMFALWMFGSTLENYWGAKRFLIFYMACGLGAAFLHLGVLYYENMQAAEIVKTISPFAGINDLTDLQIQAFKDVNTPTVGASGAIFGCLAAFGYLFPNSLIYLYFFVPIKAKWVVLGYAAVELISAIRNSAGDNVAHWAHLGGAIVGLALVYIWNKTNRRRFY